MREYETVIGLEVHCELATKTKIFCGCTTEFGGEPNTHVCPVCAGMPGTLPVLNKQVVAYELSAGVALNCDYTVLQVRQKELFLSGSSEGLPDFTALSANLPKWSCGH